MRILSLLVLCTTITFAQPLNFTVNWGTQFSAPKHSSLKDIVGHDGSGLYAIKSRETMFGPDLTLERYDRKFKPARSRDLEITEEGERGKVQHVLFLRNKLFIFYVLRNKSTHKSELYVREVNKTTLEPSAEKLKLGEADEGRYNIAIPFTFKTSRDSSKVAISYEFPNVAGEDKKTFGFIVLDDNLQPVWKRQVMIPHKPELWAVESFKVDNHGNVYLLGVSYNEKRRSKRHGKPNYNYEVLAWSDNGETMRTYPLALEDKFLTDMQIEVIDNKNLVCAGFYSAKGTFSIKGTYFLTVDLETKQTRTSSFKEFGLDFIMDNLSEREANRSIRKAERGEELELYEYDLDKLIVGKDGSSILVGEQYYVEETTSTSYLSGRATYNTIFHYYYNDIIAVKVDPEGQIEWAEKISKSQHTVSDGGFYSSYTMAIIKGRICFFFNDHPDNVNYKGVGRPLSYMAKESVVMMVSLSQHGNQYRQPVFNLREVDVITRPKVCEQVSNTEVILFGQRRKTQQFIEVDFE